MNIVVLQGRLTKKPELRMTPSKKSVTTFTMAVKRPFSQEKTDFINCVAWERTAENIEKYFDKGQLILISGNLIQNTFKDKEGNTRSKLEVNTLSFDFCEKKEKPDVNVSEIDFTDIDPSEDFLF